MFPLENLTHRKNNLFSVSLFKRGKGTLTGIASISWVVTAAGLELLGLHMLVISVNPCHTSGESHHWLSPLYLWRRSLPEITPTTSARGICLRHSTASLSCPPDVLDSHLQKQVDILIQEQGPAWVHIPSGNFHRWPSLHGRTSLNVIHLSTPEEATLMGPMTSIIMDSC